MADRVMMVFACAGAGCGCCFEAELDWDRLGTMARCPECGNVGHGTAARVSAFVVGKCSGCGGESWALRKRVYPAGCLEVVGGVVEVPCLACGEPTDDAEWLGKRVCPVCGFEWYPEMRTSRTDDHLDYRWSRGKGMRTGQVPRGALAVFGEVS